MCTPRLRYHIRFLRLLKCRDKYREYLAVIFMNLIMIINFLNFAYASGYHVILVEIIDLNFEIKFKPLVVEIDIGKFDMRIYCFLQDFKFSRNGNLFCWPNIIVRETLYFSLNVFESTVVFHSWFFTYGSQMYFQVAVIYCMYFSLNREASKNIAIASEVRSMSGDTECWGDWMLDGCEPGQLDVVGYQRTMVSLHFERSQSVLLRSACLDVNRIELTTRKRKQHRRNIYSLHFLPTLGFGSSREYKIFNRVQ